MNEEDRSKLREDLEALLASAENWLGIWEGREKEGGKGCACCKLGARRAERAGWEDGDCDFCPIKEETQLSDCIGTPYDQFLTWKLGTPQSKKAAEREYEFLIEIGLKKMRLLMEDAERGSHQDDVTMI